MDESKPGLKNSVRQVIRFNCAWRSIGSAPSPPGFLSMEKVGCFCRWSGSREMWNCVVKKDGQILKNVKHMVIQWYTIYYIIYQIEIIIGEKLISSMKLAPQDMIIPSSMLLSWRCDLSVVVACIHVKIRSMLFKSWLHKWKWPEKRPSFNLGLRLEWTSALRKRINGTTGTPSNRPRIRLMGLPNFQWFKWPKMSRKYTITQPADFKE